MLTSFIMAFYRPNINVPLFINNVHYKFSSAFKLHSSQRQLSSKSKRMKHVLGGEVKEKNNTFNLSDLIHNRKKQAHKSIIVQVASRKSCNDVLNYCSKFGPIDKAYYYVLPKNHQFVLLEYSHISSIERVLSDATYINKGHIIPCKTNVMWFRKISEISNMSPHDTHNLPYLDNTDYMLQKEDTVANAILNANSISSQMITLYNEYKIQEIEIRLKFQIITSLEQYFSSIFPNIIIHPFGSFINGFGKRLSDLDLVLFADGYEKENKFSRLVFHTKETSADEKQQTHEFMGVLADAMKYMMPGMTKVRKIFNARVPIIKFNNSFTRTECDLSMNNIIATYMSELLYLYGEMDCRVRPLVFTIRKWAHDNNLTTIHPGKTITNFSLTLLVIFYLQIEGVLPVINNLKGFAGINQLNNYLDQTYSHRININWSSRTYDDLNTLLLNFFNFYYSFNFKEYEICLREGRRFKKCDDSAMYIRNPFESGLNVSKNVAIYEITRIKSFMAEAITNLTNATPLRSTNWGILNICKFPEPKSVNIDATQIFSNENKSQKENIVISENETSENIRQTDVCNTLSTNNGDSNIKTNSLKRV